MAEYNLVSIGRRIAEVRRAHHMTQEKLADLLGVTPKHISHTECGTSCLSLKNLVEFCSLFSCSLDYLILGKSTSSDLEKLPEEIAKILCTGTEEEVGCLSRYLQMYVELTQKTQSEH